MRLEDAIIAKMAWKSEAFTEYIGVLITRALEQSDAGIAYFNNDDVPEAYQPLDKTTVGTAFRTLTKLNIIAPWRGTIASADIWGGMRRSTRPSNNGHRNQLYTLTNQGIAEAWLSRNGFHCARKQMEFSFN